MLTRRAFLKALGVSAAAAGAGYSAGKLFSHEGDRFSIHAFIPGDELIIRDIFISVQKKYSYSSMVIFAPDEIKKQLKKLHPPSNNFFGSTLIIRMNKVSDQINSDILLSDNNNPVYNPDNDFNSSFNLLREKLRNRKAEFYLSARYKESSVFSSLVNTDKKFLIVETNKGVSEKILLNNSYRNIEIEGNAGKTILQIQNGFVSVQKSSCRNKLCELQGHASDAGSVIACAPNKLILRIENS